MCANSRAYQYLGVTSWWKCGNRVLIELGGLWQCLCFFDFSLSQSSNENKFTVPRSLQYLTWWKFGDIDLLIWVSYVSSVSDHLGVDNGENSFDTNGVAWENESLQHVNLGSSDLIVSIFFVPGSVLVEPVISLGPCIEWIAKVGRSRWSQPVGWSLSHKQIINQFLIFSFSVVLEYSKASWLGTY